ncbi:MAG TPA: TRAP transporter substrate-binding protein [Syntrophorhabdales bacterium]|nr:TRAP transporter substrate-binding protein [Syntrophorhabdales bacterium]
MKRFCAMGYAVIFMIMTVFSVAVPAWAQEKVIKLRYSNLFPPAHRMAQLADQWCKEVEKRTNGRVVITYYSSSTLTPAGQTYGAVVSGIADVGESAVAFFPGRFPLTEIFSRPVGFTSGYQATKAVYEFHKKFQPKEWADTKVMFLHGSAPQIIHTKKAISSIKDVKGLRLKANAENAPTVSAVGAVPVTLTTGETYDALQKGMVDGMMFPYESLKGWKFADHIHYTLENYAVAGAAPLFVAMNKQKWNSLPKDVQITIEKLNEEWIEKLAKAWDEIDEEGKAYGIQKGLKVVTPSKEEVSQTAEKMTPIIDKYVTDMKGKGLPGAEALTFVLDFIKTHP